MDEHDNSSNADSIDLHSFMKSFESTESTLRYEEIDKLPKDEMLGFNDISGLNMEDNDETETNVDDIDYTYKIEKLIEMLQRISNSRRGYGVSSNEQEK